MTRKREESIISKSTKKDDAFSRSATAFYNERKRFLMANKQSGTRKPLTSSAKGIICLALLLALTVFASYLSIAGLNLDSEGVNVLLPWVPVSSANWPKSLPLTKGLGGGTYAEYAYSLPEDASETVLQDSANTIRARLSSMGEDDAVVSVKEGLIRMELRSMDASRLASVRSMAVMGGQFEFKDSNENVVLTEKDFERANVRVNRLSSTSTSYTVSMEFKANKEGAEKLKALEGNYLSITVDGTTVSSYATVSGDTVTASMGTNDTAYNNAYNFAFLMNYGAVDVTLNQRGVGSVKADTSVVTQVVLIVCAVLLLCALVYLLATGKLTGVSAFLAVWCALVMGLFFVATVVVPSVQCLNTGCLVAVLLGLLLAMFTSVNRTDAISKAIGEGSAPRQASRLGFKAAAKVVWLAHGAVAVVSLIMMIFAFSRSVGYTLFAMVLSSAIATVIMRAYQACFTAITNKPASFGKVK